MVFHITVSNGKAYIFNAEDVCQLREEHRITGTLIGCLPRAPRQNIHLGLPLQLLPEEATLLVEKGIGQFVTPSLNSPTEDTIDKFKMLRKKSYMEQMESARTQRVNAVLQHKEVIIEGRKRKLECDVKTTKNAKSKPETSIEEDKEALSKEGVCSLRQSDLEINPLPENSSLLQIAIETPPPCQSLTVDKNVEWSFPETDNERLRYEVFKDLWHQGYYLTTGGKFGGDFLIYPGDPLRFHSMYIARCVPYCKEMSPLDIVAMGRLASNVKKTLLLCSKKDDELCYTSLQWTGIS